MKNIHILPTDKPSRLFEILQFNFLFDNQNKYSEEYKKLHKYKNKNIYITSDEEIKEGDWCIDDEGIVKCTAHAGAMNHYYTKIILTTDQELIKDGIQAIDDEFLEWFVKNPSCEEVGIEPLMAGFVDDEPSYYENMYDIIIPKQEPKQLTDLEIAMKLEEIEKEESNRTHWLDELPNMDKNTLGKMWEAIIPKLEPKQETLEEALERIRQESFTCCSLSKSINYVTVGEREKTAFYKGAKWQAERMYSEEEVINLLETQRGNSYVAVLSATKNDELASIALNAPEPGGMKKFKKK
jgi:hypothetical protein